MKNTRILHGIMTVCLLSSMQTHSNFQDLPYPYSTIEALLPFDKHGWYLNKSWLEQLIKHNPIQTVIEVGSWLGTSTRDIAQMLSEDGKVYAVDTWEGSVEHYHNAEWSSKLPTLYEQFLSNVIHANLTHKIIPMKMTSLQAAEQFRNQNFHANLVYIDAAHDYESVTEDLNAYFPLTRDKQAILCGDDWSWQSVRNAVLDFAKTNNLTVYGAQNFWFLKEEGKFAQHSYNHNSPSSIWKVLS